MSVPYDGQSTDTGVSGVSGTNTAENGVGVHGQSTIPSETGKGGIGVRGDSNAVGVWGEGKIGTALLVLLTARSVEQAFLDHAIVGLVTLERASFRMLFRARVRAQMTPQVSLVNTLALVQAYSGKALVALQGSLKAM